MQKFTSLLIGLLLGAVQTATAVEPVDPFWRNATVYFMLPDRFHNGDIANDFPYGRKDDADYLRGFEGGDLRGVIEKIEAGYFNDLGVDAIWLAPVIENIHSYNESDKRTYAFHGYWPKDWTAVDANFGSETELVELIESAHSRGIRVLMDVILNHTGPVTEQDPEWPATWLRKGPPCDWSDYAGNVECTIHANLTDILTESEEAVELPTQLLAKWKKEGRLEQEQRELDTFFERTDYPRTPKYYLVKWLTDWVREYGVDGFRVDTVKHVEGEAWAVLKKEADLALAEWKTNNPKKKLDDRDFFMVGEVYHFGVNNFGPSVGRAYDYSDKTVDFYEHGFDSLINFGFAQVASQLPEAIFSSYSAALNSGELKGLGVLNYLGSHDDHHSFDRERQQTVSSATKLMLAPGAVQIYYGDELARPMIDDRAYGDASLRTNMNWDDLKNPETRELLVHWQKLGQFRQAHLAVGAGVHKKIADNPYTFTRTLAGEQPVVVALNLPQGEKRILVEGIFAEGSELTDHYSGKRAKVKSGRVTIDTEGALLLLSAKPKKT
ncbi:alpha-amylase family glycosyl hydrolase [Microbulbifer sp. OS29]|uniref:Alpha-amylase n=1 Tax=Microbulbifer okhotskensis TaxID=2926617 RepID=A0A9X2EUT6_9GAMM|nr:alpha-amylase family glycosyl hydrolase [Microbulbifer okhotskensis]MCO1336276.1 alpha-amylase family glycosyl hydrolase [Microbulbifer okhotskensis]